jgi:hypothetical protein
LSEPVWKTSNSIWPDLGSSTDLAEKHGEQQNTFLLHPFEVLKVGWLDVLKTLDRHYKYLPETKLHEAIDEFLFLLRRLVGEGATAFASRFKIQLNR